MATRCWALNQDGQRCELPADHMEDPESLHEISHTWSDDECYDPTKPVTVKEYGRLIVPDVEHLVEGYVPPEKRKCIVCSHKMHAGPCGAPDSDGFDCDCAAGIEE